MTSSSITTRNLRLRPLHITDSDAVISLRTNPQVFYWKPPESPSDAMRWLNDRLDDPLSLIYAVEIIRHGPTNGNAQPIVIGLTGAHRLPEIGYIFEPEYWGKGYATEALRAWMAMYWSKVPHGYPTLEGTRGKSLGTPFLRAETGPEGKASAKVLQKCGFVFDRYRNVEEGEGEKGTLVLDCWKAEQPAAGVGDAHV